MAFSLFKKTVPTVPAATIMGYKDQIGGRLGEPEIDFGKRDIIVPEGTPKNQISKTQTVYYDLAFAYANLHEKMRLLTKHRDNLQEKLDNFTKLVGPVEEPANENSHILKKNKSNADEVKTKIDLIDQITNNLSSNLSNLTPDANLKTIIDNCFPQETLDKLDEHRDHFLLRLITDVAKLLLIFLTPVLFFGTLGALAVSVFCCSFLSEKSGDFIYNYPLYPLAKKNHDGHYFSLGKTTSMALVENVEDAVKDVVETLHKIPVLQK